MSKLAKSGGKRRGTLHSAGQERQRLGTVLRWWQCKGSGQASRAMGMQSRGGIRKGGTGQRQGWCQGQELKKA